jgi:transcriptional regulator with XRE-family HTH domain
MQIITHMLRLICHLSEVKRGLDRQLALFLRKTRGGMSYAQFAKKTGVSHMTLFRIEKGEHHLTLDKLDTVLRKLKIRLSDVFPEEY